MADQRKGGIAWCDFTFNPWWGCQRVSEGCRNCYAAGFAKRTGLAWGPTADRRFFGDAHWRKPEQWNVLAKRDGVRLRVFCASMGDVFEDRADLAEHQGRLWQLIEKTPHLDWLLLTKRPENVRRMVPSTWGRGGWPPHAWLGFTAEDQPNYERRLPIVVQIPGPVVRFCSYEPAIGPIDFGMVGTCPKSWGVGYSTVGFHLDLVIVGGESGPGARPFDISWARSTIRQCREAGVPSFVKQGGASNACAHSRSGGCLSCLPADLRVREFPHA